MLTAIVVIGCYLMIAAVFVVAPLILTAGDKREVSDLDGFRETVAILSDDETMAAVEEAEAERAQRPDRKVYNWEDET